MFLLLAAVHTIENRLLYWTKCLDYSTGFMLYQKVIIKKKKKHLLSIVNRNTFHLSN